MGRRKGECREQLLEASVKMKANMQSSGAERVQANRYGPEAKLPLFQAGVHVPILGLMNPSSGGLAGADILEICWRSAYYCDTFFNILEVVKGRQRGGPLDRFRQKLVEAAVAAKRQGARCRLISAGGDGTGSFALSLVFLALLADPSRPASEGVADSGNGFIWTDEEMETYFPALAQMPLGSANDFANILGWGQKYPGNRASLFTSRARALARWFEAAIAPATTVVDFDVWGMLPLPSCVSSSGGHSLGGEPPRCDFKLAELAGQRGFWTNAVLDGKRQIQLKEAGLPVPLFICLYFSCGFGAYMTGRFQLNRRKTPFRNRLEYARQGIGIVGEPTPPQMAVRLDDVEVDCNVGLCSQARSSSACSATSALGAAAIAPTTLGGAAEPAPEELGSAAGDAAPEDATGDALCRASGAVELVGGGAVGAAAAATSAAGAEGDGERRPEAYFPPRRARGRRGRAYREVGFYNVNWQAHMFHGADRAPFLSRLCCGARQHVQFNDGMIDMYRWKFKSFVRNPTFRVQTDKREDMVLRHVGGKGRGVFIQWDGESRFAFSPSGDSFNIYVRKILTIPVLLGPWQNPAWTGAPSKDAPAARFAFEGRTPEDRDFVRKRILSSVSGELAKEMNASSDEISQASLSSASTRALSA